MKVRFINNFIIDFIYTIVNEDGELVVETKSKHIAFGDVYNISGYDENEDGTVNLTLEDGAVINRVDPALFELTDLSKVAPRTGGCGCGGK